MLLWYPFARKYFQFFLLVMLVSWTQSATSQNSANYITNVKSSHIWDLTTDSNDCETNSDCSKIAFSQCHHGICTCYPYYIRYNSTLCLKASLLGFECLVNEQCTMKVANSRCIHGVCECEQGYTPLRRDNCLTGAKIGQLCATDEQCLLSSPFSMCKFIIPRIYGRCSCLPDLTSNEQNQCVPYAPVSLGKYCTSSEQCQLRDSNTYCVNNKCECIVQNTLCNSNNTGCHQDTFQCRNGQCISWYFVCDGHHNCDDGSDEHECNQWRCPKVAFQCQNGDCVSRSKVCNGKRDCLDGSDEFKCYDDCYNMAFRCQNGACLPQYTFCNAVSSCQDNSDEDPAICQRGETCPEEHFRCDNGLCRSTSVLCSGVDGCGDNSDETHCNVCYCPNSSK